MIEAKLPFGDYSSKPEDGTISEFGRAVVITRLRYDTLTEALGRLGTEVHRARILENNQDRAPFQFVQEGYHEFIFPPQEGLEIHELGAGMYDTKPGHELTEENSRVTYDRSKVRGKLKIWYDDARDTVELRIATWDGAPVIPPDAQAAVEAAIAPFELAA